MVEDEKSLRTAAKDAGAGLVLGSAGGATAGNVEKSVRGNLLKKQVDINQARKGAINYYGDYLQDTSITRDKNNKIIFGKQGIKKTKNTSADIRKFQAILLNIHQLFKTKTQFRY